MLKKIVFLILFCATTFGQEHKNSTQRHLSKGNKLSKNQEYEKAIVSYLKALDILEKEQDSSKLSSAYISIGVVNARLKNFDKTIWYLEKANQLIIKNNNAKLRTIYNLSGFYYDNKNVTSFLSTIKKAESLAVELKNNEILSAIYSTYCNYYRDIKQYKKSITYGLKSYELKRKLGLNPDITINNIGYSYLLDKNYPKAIEYLSKVIRTPNKKLRTYVFNNLKNAYEKSHQKNKALHYANKYILLNDSLTKAQEKIKVASLIEKYETSKKQQQITNLKTENKLKESKLRNQKNWFLGICVLIILSSFLVLLWLKNKKTQQDLEKASIQHKLLRNQLNPHFLFHSLNSIQAYIYQNKKEASVNYLANYSKLIRAIFDSSDKDFITIEEDKNAIENYLALQKLNFNTNVNLSLMIDDEITDCKIPPMLVQPFVENAFLHGVNAIENGKISVDYKQDNNNIKICIIDNGNGFKKSKSNNSLSKISSSNVIEKRIDNLRKTHGFNISIDTKSSKSGTTVTLLFPKKY